MSEATYWDIINYLLLFNTLPLAGFAVLCFVWAGVARTMPKQTIFSAFGGFLALFVILRVVVILLPMSITLLVVISIIQGFVGLIQFTGFFMVTFIVKRRMTELKLNEQVREQAMATPQAEKLESFEDLMFDFGRKAGWIK